MEENYDLFCGEELPFLVDMVFAEGQASYVALHGNFNVIGITAGEALAVVSTSDRGPQNCTIFGNPEFECTDGVDGVLSPLGAPMEGDMNEASPGIDGETSSATPTKWAFFSSIVAAFTMGAAGVALW